MRALSRGSSVTRTSEKFRDKNYLRSAGNLSYKYSPGGESSLTLILEPTLRRDGVRGILSKAILRERERKKNLAGNLCLWRLRCRGRLLLIGCNKACAIVVVIVSYVDRGIVLTYRQKLIALFGIFIMYARSEIDLLLYTLTLIYIY